MQQYFMLTQFDTRFARRCFPCADEPAMKAMFDITLIVKSDEVALSTMVCGKNDSKMQVE